MAPANKNRIQIIDKKIRQPNKFVKCAEYPDYRLHSIYIFRMYLVLKSPVECMLLFNPVLMVIIVTCKHGQIFYYIFHIYCDIKCILVTNIQIILHRIHIWYSYSVEWCLINIRYSYPVLIWITNIFIFVKHLFIKLCCS